MFAKRCATIALLGTALTIGAAVAQTPAPAPSTNSKMSAPAPSVSHEGLWRASKLVGIHVYNTSDESLGSINDLIVDKDGNIKNVVIRTSGFLGVGEHYITVSFDKLKFTNEPVKMAATTPPGGGAGGSLSSSTQTVGSATPPQRESMAGSWYPDHAVLSMSNDEMKSAPEFKY